MGKLAVATIGAPEFINITSINPLISKCDNIQKFIIDEVWILKFNFLTL